MQLPKGVFERHGAYHLDLGYVDARRKSKKLSRIADGESALYEALAKAKKPGGRLLSDLFDDYLLFGVDELAENTKTDYRGYIKRTLRPKFGHMEPDELTPGQVAQLLEKRRRGDPKAGVRKAPSVANKEAACLSTVFQYGIRNGRCKVDPTRGIRRNKVKPRDRYPRHPEFLSHFAAAPEWLQDVIAGVYLMELRPGEARALPRSVIHDEGIVIEESKTGKVKIIRWNDDLRFFVRRAATRAPGAERLFTNGSGDPVTKWAMASAMRRLRKKLGLKTGESFHFHDIRAKGESDHKTGGHGLLALYRRAKVVEPTNWLHTLRNDPDEPAELGSHGAIE
jgi:hypothetical protein